MTPRTLKAKVKESLNEAANQVPKPSKKSKSKCKKVAKEEKQNVGQLDEPTVSRNTSGRYNSSRT